MTLADAIFFILGLNIGDALGSTPEFYALVGKLVCANNTYSIKTKDSAALPTIELNASLSAKDFEKLVSQN